MKSTYKILNVLLILTLVLASCKKEKSEEEEKNAPANYQEITRDDIVAKASTLSGNSIEATNSNGNVLNVGDVIIYKTNNDRYGKMEILAIDDANNKKLTIKAITYKNDGSVFYETSSLNVRGTYLCDLDAMVETQTDADFQWQRVNSTDTNLKPIAPALFAVYDF